MFLKAGAVSLALLLASRLLGLARESAQAAAFGSTALADIAVLMLTLPDWITGVLVSGALAYVLMPAWAGQPKELVAAAQRHVMWWLMAGAAILVLALLLLRYSAVRLLAGGLPQDAIAVATGGLVWSALALPAALLAALWATRLQHERDFLGLYAGNLFVNGALVATVALVGWQELGPAPSVVWLGCGLMAAMCLRLFWLALRLRRYEPTGAADTQAMLPRLPLWLWAALSAGLPLALPFAARSIASQTGEGGLATFNYAWKLVELPLLLAIQLVATLAFPAIAQVLSNRDRVAATQLAAPIRSAFALAWTLACAAASALLLGAPAIAQLLFGWGRMDPAALANVAHWGTIAAWGLLPQSLIAVTLTVLASQRRLRAAAAAYGLALAVLLAAAALGLSEGASLMKVLNLLFAGVALAGLVALGADGRAWLPWRTMGLSAGALGVVAVIAHPPGFASAALGLTAALAAALLAAFCVIVGTWLGSDELRRALRR